MESNFRGRSWSKLSALLSLVCGGALCLRLRSSELGVEARGRAPSDVCQCHRCLTLIHWEAALPWWLSGKESTCQHRRREFNPWLGKIPWSRKWQPTPAFLSGKSHGQRCLAGYSPWGRKRIKHGLAAKTTRHRARGHQQRTVISGGFGAGSIIWGEHFHGYVS